jgi:hypothetical protein
MSELTNFERLGAVGLAAMIVFIGYKIMQLLMDQWRASTSAQERAVDALNRNTDSFEKLAAVFEKQAERDVEFQKFVTGVLNKNTSLLTSAHQKITELHGAVLRHGVPRYEGDDQVG